MDLPGIEPGLRSKCQFSTGYPPVENTEFSNIIIINNKKNTVSQNVVRQNVLESKLVWFSKVITSSL